MLLFPVCFHCKSETGYIHGNKCYFRRVEAEEKPSKKSKRGGAKDLSLRKEGKLGSHHTVPFSKGTWHHIKIRERKGPSRGTSKVWTSWAWYLRARVWGEVRRRDLAPRKTRPRSSMGLGQKYEQAQECGESQGNHRTYFRIFRIARIRSRFRSINAHAEQKKI